MKKILTLLLALWMLTGCVAMAAGNQLVVGSTTAMSGAFFTDLFGSNTADIDVRALLHGYNLMRWDNETGTYQINDSVVAGMAVSRDAQNNRVYTFDLYGDLKFSDGSAITAKDYAFSILLTASPERAVRRRRRDFGDGCVPVRQIVRPARRAPAERHADVHHDQQGLRAVFLRDGAV